jgi:hypothetical protein
MWLIFLAMRTVTSHKRPAGHTNRRRVIILASALILAETAVMRLKGYRVGANVVVRCRQGHLFTTIWLPGVSLKSLRLGLWRFQRCPVGSHWSVMTPVRESDLTDGEMQSAHQNQDIRIP